ncbi:MAG: hypothetical protein D3910_23405 [Candidatus Electrothrix sp. ATG2]|nr:hypothetical protein [Candidatus Electrothrix sp. ATG2]
MHFFFARQSAANVDALSGTLHTICNKGEAGLRVSYCYLNASFDTEIGTLQSEQKIFMIIKP